MVKEHFELNVIVWISDYLYLQIGHSNITRLLFLDVFHPFVQVHHCQEYDAGTLRTAQHRESLAGSCSSISEN